MNRNPETGEYEFDYERERRLRREKIKKVLLYVSIPLMGFAGAYLGSELSLKKSTIEVNLYSKGSTEPNKLNPIEK